MSILTPGVRGIACETRRKLALCFVCVMLCAPAVAGVHAVAPNDAGQVAAQPQAGAAEIGAPDEGKHADRGLVDVLARLLNFAILAGTLVYLLRSPLRTYLTDRGTQIRSDLVAAAEMKQTAASQIAEIDRRMKALPHELDALRAQGAQEIAAEEARIQAAAAAERDRLLAQAKREIDLQVRVAERDLVAFAADLAVGVASERIRKSITDDDQKRLVDRYVRQLKSGEQRQS